MREPVQIRGVLAFPNEEGNRNIRFIDLSYNTLFTIPDGGSILVRYGNGPVQKLTCEYIDDYHAVIGNQVFHICQYAEIMMAKGGTYAPEHLPEGAEFGTYEIYQIESDKAPYLFQSYDKAQKNLNPKHYRLAYTFVLPPNLTLDEIYMRHNRDDRPFASQMRSLSVSDVVVLNRGGKREAFYVDSFGFQKADKFLQKPPRKKERGEAR